MNYIWPIALVVLSNVVYQICAKSVPGDIHPLASLSITYLVAAGFSLALYFILNNKDASLVREYSRLNWAPFVLGLVIVGLEVGFIYAYKAGWGVSTASVVQSAFLAIALIFVGYLVFHEPITRNKLIGVAACIVGIIFINK